MKKIIKKGTAAILLIAILLSIAGCQSLESSESSIGPIGHDNKDVFYVNFINNTDDEIYEIHFEYLVNGDVLGGGAMGNANHSTIKKGEDFSKEFIPKDFPTSSDLTKFQIVFFILDTYETEYSVKNIIEIPAAYGNSYNVSLTGNAKEGYVAEL